MSIGKISGSALILILAAGVAGTAFGAVSTTTWTRTYTVTVSDAPSLPPPPPSPTQADFRGYSDPSCQTQIPSGGKMTVGGPIARKPVNQAGTMLETVYIKDINKVGGTLGWVTDAPSNGPIISLIGYITGPDGRERASPSTSYTINADQCMHFVVEGKARPEAKAGTYNIELRIGR